VASRPSRLRPPLVDGVVFVSKAAGWIPVTTMGDEQQTNPVGTTLDDGAEPVYEDGSPVEFPPEPHPTQPDSALDGGAI
jgi:hypothetical protein